MVDYFLHDCIRAESATNQVLFMNVFKEVEGSGVNLGAC